MNSPKKRFFAFDDEDPSQVYPPENVSEREISENPEKETEVVSDTPSPYWKLDRGEETVTSHEKVTLVSSELRDSWDDEDEEIPQSLPMIPKRPSVWGSSLFWLLGGLIGIYCLIQGIWFWQTVVALPPFLQIIMTAILFLLLGITGVALLRLTRFYWKLQINRQQYLRYVENQNHLRQWQGESDSSENRKKICRILRDFVRNYPKENLQTHPLLAKGLGRKPKTRGEMIRNLEFLCRTSPDENLEKWLKTYQEFQDFLDTCARQYLERAAKIVGAKTAISPNPLWDMLIVVYWSFRFMRELCEIYHLRVNYYATCQLVLQMWVTAICSSAVDQMEDAAQVGAEHVSQMLTSNKLMTTIFGQAATKTASGVANYYLFRRLGRAAMEQIRPLVAERKT